MEPCVVRHSVWRNGLLTLYGLVPFLLFGGAFIKTKSYVGMDWSGAAIITSFLAIILAITFFFGRRVINRSPLLIIDQAGITVRRIGLIPWREIKTTRLVRAVHVDVLSIIFNDPAKWQPLLSFGNKMSWKLFPKLGAGENVSLQNVDVDARTIEARIEEMTSLAQQT